MPLLGGVPGPTTELPTQQRIGGQLVQGRGQGRGVGGWHEHPTLREDLDEGAGVVGAGS